METGRMTMTSARGTRASIAGSAEPAGHGGASPAAMIGRSVSHHEIVDLLGSRAVRAVSVVPQRLHRAQPRRAPRR
jgi:hypothetical protein